MKYPVLIQPGPTSYAATAPDLPGLFIVGETLEELHELIPDAIAFHIRGLRADGDPVPEPSLLELVEVAI